MKLSNVNYFWFGGSVKLNKLVSVLNFSLLCDWVFVGVFFCV